jgi:hypothetical protein
VAPVYVAAATEQAAREAGAAHREASLRDPADESGILLLLQAFGSGGRLLFGSDSVTIV